MNALLEKFNENRDVEELSTVDRIKVVEKHETSNRFLLDSKDFDYSGQYFHMYKSRLNDLKQKVRKNCIDKWDNSFKLKGKRVVEKEKVLDISAGEPCWCIGTIYCEMKYKPNVLEEVINDTYGAPDLVKTYMDAEGNDEIMLEDESGRVLLVGDFIKSTPFVTGVVVGLLGMEAEAGTFQVLDICYPTPLPQNPLPKLSNSGNKIAFVSGLGISTNHPDRLLKLQLLQELLLGRLYEQEKISKVGRLIICGNSIDAPFNSADSGNLITCLDEFGNFLSNTLQSIPITIMPGSKDPSNKSLPQQPLHTALFKENLQPYFEGINRDILHLSTNPANLEFNNIDILAVSGESINDLTKYVIPYQEGIQDEDLINENFEHKLDLMECTLKWQNIAPSAPDTLWSYPFKNSDPFILNRWPHVYLVGNQPKFGMRDVKLGDKTVKIISVPEFCNSGSVVLLDLNSFETELITLEM